MLTSRISQLIPLGKENCCASQRSGTNPLYRGSIWPYIGHVGGDHTPTALNSILFTFMRKIESQMCQAVQANINWKNANTEVTIDQETNTSSVYLHGNLIATVTDNDMTIYDGGWQSNTTKSRLNALCDYFCVDGEGVFQKDFTWYVRKFVGCINGKNIFKNEEFESGYTFA